MPRFYGKEAVGFIETIGLVPAVYGCDKMLKASEVELVSYENSCYDHSYR